jgi:cutinase
MLVHNSATQWSAAGKAAVKAIVLFGDPFNGRAVTGVDASVVKEICAGGDSICRGGAGSAGHLSYGRNAGEAAQFVQSKIQL